MAVLFGAGEEVRTLDIYLGKVMLYQLSYARNVNTVLIILYSLCYGELPGPSSRIRTYDPLLPKQMR